MTKHTINLSEETFVRLQSLAAQGGLSADDLIVRAIERYLEDVEDITEAEEALRAYRAGGGVPETLDALSVRLGLDR